MSSIEGFTPQSVVETAEQNPKNHLRTILSRVTLATVLSVGPVACSLVEDNNGPKPNTGASSPEVNPVIDPPESPGNTDSQPNIIEIMLDDADMKAMEYLPNMNKYIAEEGVTFSNFFAARPLCCSARATGLTGQYDQNHGVSDNVPPYGGYASFHNGKESVALPLWLENSGYETYFIGKYFNGYPFPYKNRKAGISPSEVPPGWSYFVSPVKGDLYGGKNYKLNVNGEVDEKRRKKFIDDVLVNLTLKALEDAPEDQPYYLTLRPIKPHSPFTIPSRLKGSEMFSGVTRPRTPAFNEADVSDKPTHISRKPMLTAEQIAKVDQDFRKRILGMQVIDHAIPKIFEILKERGDLDNTIIIFTSDNGYHQGEHRLTYKNTQYNDAANLPLYVWGKNIPEGVVIDELTSMIDLAPTIADFANAKPLVKVDGLSLVPLLTGEQKSIGRYYVQLRGGREQPLGTEAPKNLEPYEPGIGDRAENEFAGVISKDGLKLIQYLNGDRYELYDLKNDPYELNNLFGPTGKEELETMYHTLKTRVLAAFKALKILENCAGKACTLPDLR